MRFETTTEIDAPRDAVWSTLADVDSWPEWTTTVTWARRLSGRTWAPGTRVRIKQPRMPAVVWEVTEVEPGESFAWRASGIGLRTIGTHRLSMTAGHRVAVTLGIRQSGALAPVVWLLTSRWVRSNVRTEAAGLKRRCEQAPARAPAPTPAPAPARRAAAGPDLADR